MSAEETKEKMVDVMKLGGKSSETILIAIAQQLSRIADVLEGAVAYSEGKIIGIDVRVSGEIINYPEEQ